MHAQTEPDRWRRGPWSGRSPFSVAHPADDNVLTVSDGVKLLNVEVLKTPPCPTLDSLCGGATVESFGTGVTPPWGVWAFDSGWVCWGKGVA